MGDLVAGELEGGDRGGPLRWSWELAWGMFLHHVVEGFGRIKIQPVREQGFSCTAELAVAKALEGMTDVEVFLACGMRRGPLPLTLLLQGLQSFLPELAHLPFLPQFQLSPDGLLSPPPSRASCPRGSGQRGRIWERGGASFGRWILGVR